MIIVDIDKWDNSHPKPHKYSVDFMYNYMESNGAVGALSALSGTRTVSDETRYSGVSSLSDQITLSRHSIKLKSNHMKRSDKSNSRLEQKRWFHSDHWQLLFSLYIVLYFFSLPLARYKRTKTEIIQQAYSHATRTFWLVTPSSLLLQLYQTCQEQQFSFHAPLCL